MIATKGSPESRAKSLSKFDNSIPCSSAKAWASNKALVPTAYPIGLITLPTPFKTLPVLDNILSLTVDFPSVVASALIWFFKFVTCSVVNFSNFIPGFFDCFLQIFYQQN